MTQMLELHIQNNDITNGSIPVSWCVDRALIDLYKEKGITDLQVILCVRPEGKFGYSYCEQRFVVPLSDLMTYVDFRFPGNNRIFAFITGLSAKEARRTYLAKENYYQYKVEILDYDGTDYKELLKPGSPIDSAGRFENWKTLTDGVAEPLTVDVPKDVFAKEPPEWEKEWVNLFFNYKPIDQCNYRKRRLFSYTVQPIIMLLNMFVRLLCFIFALLIGSRAISIKPLLHPISMDMDDAWNMTVGKSIFVRDVKDVGDDTIQDDLIYFAKRYWSAPFMPLILIPIILFIALGKVATLGIIVGVLLGLAIAVIIILLIVDNFYSITDFLSNLFPVQNKNWMDNEELIEMLSCNGQKKPMSVAEVPGKYKTVRLRFRDLKAKVCRPFAR